MYKLHKNADEIDVDIRLQRAYKYPSVNTSSATLLKLYVNPS